MVQVVALAVGHRESELGPRAFRFLLGVDQRHVAAGLGESDGIERRHGLLSLRRNLEDVAQPVRAHELLEQLVQRVPFVVQALAFDFGHAPPPSSLVRTGSGPIV